MLDLKPCPHCGGKAHFDHDDDGWNWIECADCGASTNARVSAMDDCKPLLAEQWNRRHTPAGVQAPPAPLSDAQIEGLLPRAALGVTPTADDEAARRREMWKEHGENCGREI